MARPKTPPQARVLGGEHLRADRADHGAAVPLKLPPCPSWLKSSAKKHWEVLGAQMVAVGLLSALDGDVFALHCDNVTRYADVCAKLDDLDSWIATTPNGFEMQTAYVQIRNKLQEQIIKTAREFGLTPAARSSIRNHSPAQGDLFGQPTESPDEFTTYERVS